MLWQALEWLSYGTVAYLYGRVFLPYCETRKVERFSLADPILPYLPRRNYNLCLAAFQYLSIASILYQHPWTQAHLVVRSHALFFLIRSFLIWVTPLEPPQGCITLRCEGVEGLTNTEPFDRDLVPSGHCATLALHWLWTRNPFHLVGLICTIPMLMMQRVHYTLDIMVAPMAALTCWWLVAGK